MGKASRAVASSTKAMHQPEYRTIQAPVRPAMVSSHPVLVVVDNDLFNHPAAAHVVHLITCVAQAVQHLAGVLPGHRANVADFSRSVR